MSSSNPLLIAGTGCARLAEGIAHEMHLELAPCAIERFPDGEVSVEIRESVRRRDVVIIQSTAPPVNDHLVELLLIGDACRRAAATHITAIIPYFGYSRSDRRHGLRSPVGGRVTADLLESAGIGHVVTVDVHAPQIEGFFRVPTDDVCALNVLCDAVSASWGPDAVIVAPDLGGVRRARDLSRPPDPTMALCLKQRRSGSDVEVAGVVGDVKGRECVIVDDMISTGGTVAESARALREEGARAVTTVLATHAVFAPGAAERLASAGVSRVVVTDTVPRSGALWPQLPQLEVVSVAPLLARVIQRLESGASLRGAG